MIEVIDKLAEVTKVANPECNGDYRNEDGLLICGKCHTAKECKITVPMFEGTRIVSCVCKCKREQLNAEEEERKELMRKQEIDRMRSIGIQDKKIIEYNFENDDRQNTAVGNIARKYVDKFSQMKEKNFGILFYGDTGTGKSFFAGCIANALIDKGIPVLATSITRLINQLFSVEDKNELIKDICKYDLLIIDDIGAERSTDYALEQVYTLIDERYKSNKPMIITTNLSYEEMSNATDLKLKRIYDRILEKCYPIKVEGQRRRETGFKNMREMNNLLFN